MDAAGGAKNMPSRAMAKYTRGPAKTIALMLAARLTMVKTASRSPVATEQPLGHCIHQPSAPARPSWPIGSAYM